MPHFLQTTYSFASHLTVFVAALGILTGIVGLWFKKLAMPKISAWIKVNILDKIEDAKNATAAVKKDVEAVKVATTVNGHSQDEPTLRDDLSDIKQHLAKQDNHLARQDKARASDRKALTALTRRVTNHLADEEAERAQVALLVAQVAELKAARHQ